MTGDLGQPIAYGRTAEIYAWHCRDLLSKLRQVCLGRGLQPYCGVQVSIPEGG